MTMMKDDAYKHKTHDQFKQKTAFEKSSAVNTLKIDRDSTFESEPSKDVFYYIIIASIL